MSSSSNYNPMGNWIKNHLKRPFQCLKRARKGKQLQECQSENYESLAPSGESLEAFTDANQMHRIALLHSLNTG